MSNEAAFIPAPREQVSVGQVDKYVPGPGDILVKNLSLSFNALEAKIQKLALLPLAYPAIIGNSFAGTVAAVGPGVSSFQVGDKVGVTRSKAVFANPAYGSFQKYALAYATSSSKLHPDTDLNDASATMINIASVVAALSVHMGLGDPSTPSSTFPAPKGSKQKKLLVYGGSSPLGALAVRYAVDLGYDVVTTSSPASRSFVAQHGPEHIIDHQRPHDQVLSDLKSAGPYPAGVFDAIGSRPVDALMGELLHSDGGGKYFTVNPPLPGPGPQAVPRANVERVFASYHHALVEKEHEGLAEWMFGVYIPSGLVDGRIIPSRWEKLDGGLAAVQGAIDRMWAGQTGGRKLVANPWE